MGTARPSFRILAPMRTRSFLLVAVAALTLAVAGTSLFRTVRSFYRLDFPVRWVKNWIEVTAVPEGSTAQQARLAAGDRIVEVEGVAVARLDDPVFVLAGGDEHELTVVDRGGESRTLLFHPPPPDFDEVYLARSVVGLVGLACAFIALISVGRRETATFMLLACASFVVGVVPHRTAAAVPALQLVHRAANAALPLLMVRFFAIFPESRRSMRWYDVTMVAAVALAAVSARMPSIEAWWQVATSVLRVLFTLALLVGIGFQSRRWWLAARQARIRRQIEWAALGLFVGLTPLFGLVLLPRWLGIAFEPFAWMGIFPMAAIPIGILAALAEYRLWDLEPIARDSVSATLVAVVGGFIFVLTNHALVSYARGLGSLRNLFAFATGVLLVVLLQPVRQRVERFLDQWLYHGRPTPRWLLTHSARDLARATDPRELLARLSEALLEGLDFEQAATYLRSGAGGFSLVTGTGDEVPAYLPATVASADFPQPQEVPLQRAGYAQRIPLERVGTVHGLLYLGLRRGVYPLGSEGQEVVGTFATQAALALESARYLDDLRRQAEEYRILHANTQRIIESSAAAILVCDATGRILSANTEAADVFGGDAAGLVGRTLESLLELPAHWAGHLPLHAENAEVPTRATPPRRVVMAVSVLELDSGSFNGRVVVLQDVTELRELQDRMREQDRLAALGRLASGLAHEINTPLTGIASFAQMLGDMTPADDPRAALVGKLVNQSFRVSRIIANLREAVRGSRDEQAVMPLAEVAARAARDAARSLGAERRLAIAPDPPRVQVLGAPGAVELAVSNLVRNALEASPDGAGVAVSVAETADWGEVRVEDGGPGVPAELLEKVFEPFFSTKTERGGTGLGLAITRDMIGQLGGEVRIENLPSGGARAIIRLRKWKPSVPSS